MTDLVVPLQGMDPVPDLEPLTIIGYLKPVLSNTLHARQRSETGRFLVWKCPMR